MCANILALPFQSDTDSGQVGINLGDPIFRGVYHGKRGHEDDLEQVVQRALDVGCTKLMVTGSDLKESAHAIELAEQFCTQRS
jgi:TatD DNase family protein